MLRRATDADAPAIARLFRRSFGTLAFLPTLHTPEGDLGFFSGVVRDEEVWVWDEDGRVVGFERNEDARRFYERHGFSPVEQTDGSANEEREPDVRYAWRP